MSHLPEGVLGHQNEMALRLHLFGNEFYRPQTASQHHRRLSACGDRTGRAEWTRAHHPRTQFLVVIHSLRRRRCHLQKQKQRAM